MLFLDEPTSGVDPVTRREFWTHINGLVEKGVTIVVTTHFMDEAEYCDRIALVFRGRRSSPPARPDELKDQAATAECPDPSMEDAFIALVSGSMREDVRLHGMMPSQAFPARACGPLPQGDAANPAGSEQQHHRVRAAGGACCSFSATASIWTSPGLRVGLVLEDTSPEARPVCRGFLTARPICDVSTGRTRRQMSAMR